MRKGMMMLAVVLTSLLAFAPGMNAQRMRMTATVLPNPDPAAFEEIVRFCPGCRPGAEATLEFVLPAPLFPERYDRDPSFELGTGANSGTFSLGGETWPMLGTLVISADREQRHGAIVLENPSMSRPVRGVVRANFTPWLSIDIPVIPLDGVGRLATVNTTAIRYDNGNSHLSVVLCRGAEGGCEGHGFTLLINSVTIDAHPTTGVNSSREAVVQKDASEGMEHTDTPRAACGITDRERGTEPLPPPTIAEVRAAMSTLNHAMQKINEGNGKRGPLLADPMLFEETQCAVDTLRRMMTDIQQNPGRYIGELQVF